MRRGPGGDPPRGPGMLERGSIPHSPTPRPAPKKPSSKSCTPQPNPSPPNPGLCWAWIAPVTPKHPPASPPSTCSANAGINSWQDWVSQVFASVTGLSPGAPQLLTSPQPREVGLSVTSTPGVSEPPRWGHLGEGPLGVGGLGIRRCSSGEGTSFPQEQEQDSEMLGERGGRAGGSALPSDTRLPPGHGPRTQGRSLLTSR